MKLTFYSNKTTKTTEGKVKQDLHLINDKNIINSYFMKTIKLITLIILLAFLPKVKAEEKDSLQKPVFGIIFSSDLNFYSASRLNEYLKNNDIELLSDNSQIYYPTIGMYLKNNENSPSKLELLFDIPLKYNSSDNFSELISSGIKLNYSYDIINSKSWNISPCIGSSIKYDILTIKHANMNSIISNSNLEETFYRKNNFDINIGLEVCKNIDIKGFLINISLTPAYKLNLGDPQWYNATGNKVSAIPDFRTSCFYLTFKTSIPLTNNRLTNMNFYSHR